MYLYLLNCVVFPVEKIQRCFNKYPSNSATINSSNTYWTHIPLKMYLLYPYPTYDTAGTLEMIDQSINLCT